MNERMNEWIPTTLTNVAAWYKQINRLTNGRANKWIERINYDSKINKDQFVDYIQRINQSINARVLTDTNNTHADDVVKGLDARTAFTIKENVEGPIVGDVDIRRQAKLSKSALGLCAPLALETNGKNLTWQWPLKCDKDNWREIKQKQTIRS